MVVYFIAGNFGLVPTPFGGHARARDPSIAVPSFDGFRAEAIAPPVLSAPPSPRPKPGRIVASRPRVDRTPPAVTISTAPGTQLGLAGNPTVAGTAADDESGVRKVDVVFTDSSGTEHRYPAKLSCGDTGGERCTWTVGVPDAAGTYSVGAMASDGASNIARTRSISVSVIDLNKSTGGAVTGTVRTVGGVVDVLANTLRSLLGHGPR